MKFEKTGKKAERKNDAKASKDLIPTKKKADKLVEQSKKTNSIDNKATTSSAAKPNNDIDGIFAAVVKQKSEIETKEVKQPKVKAKQSAQPIATMESSSSYGLMKSANVSIISPEAPLERIDKESGLPVYKAHLLKVGEGGGTELCPFDCDCCF
jgi:hypothetical protein